MHVWRLAELQALEFEEERIEYEEVEQTTPEGTALMAQWRALKAACDSLSPVGRYHVASVSYRKCAQAVFCPILGYTVHDDRSMVADVQTRPGVCSWVPWHSIR